MNNQVQNDATFLKMVYVVTCFGKVVGVFVQSETAFREQMNLVNKGRIAELIPMVITYDL